MARVAEIRFVSSEPKAEILPRQCHVNRASLTLPVEALQALFQAVEVFAPEGPVPL
jgi:hypothetical protein